MPRGESVRAVLPSVFPRERTPDVDPGEFFDPDFMETYTQFDSFDGFCVESPWEIRDDKDLTAVSTAELDQYVRQTTKFDDWAAMRNRAAEREVRDRLLL